jgi:chromosomal replication initiator protein
MHEILAHAARLFGVTVDELASPRRYRHLVQARQATAWALKKCYPRLSMEAIGELLGGRDHSTIVHAIQRAEELAQADAHYRNQLHELITDAPPTASAPPGIAWWARQACAGRVRLTPAA